MKREYKGHYFDKDKSGNQVTFDFKMNVDLDEKLSFTGTVWEEEFSGISGKMLSVKGFINEDHISFVKKYPCAYGYDENHNVVINESQSGHDVIYDGYWDNSNGLWSGEWEIEGETTLTHDKIHTQIFIGKFEMKLTETSEA